MNFVHRPVLLNEVVDSFNIENPRSYLDLTAGGGGHAMAMISKFPSMKAVLLDRDTDAVTHLLEKFKGMDNVKVVKASSGELDKILFLMKMNEIDIIFADLGVSSYQFDTAERGFSIQKDGPLDMRMDNEDGLTALEYIKRTGEAEIKNILSIYAQEREAGKVAKILKKCAEEGMTTTSQFAGAIRNAKRYGKQGIDPSTQVFMALRMAVNDEIGQLEKMLRKGFSKLSPNGIMGVITFHSTEDRIVKNFFKDRKINVPYYINDNDKVPYSFAPVSICGPLSASEEEMKENPRSRSAKLRLISKGLLYN
ncbi:MAG TPA: 16S rRNA (cytosine(1402)-N(4))-methyltransferase RsmH [bacterium]|nr:16S rRNA (cytosine(1402)-N(4))-methyltransferase RsmH [bacterium]